MLSKLYVGIIVLLSFSLVLLFNGEKACGATFPEKPIQLIVNFSPGSGADTDARGIAPFLQKYIGVSVMIENVEGATGKIGCTKVWRAKPDGYTLVTQDIPMALIGEYILNPEYRIVDFSQVFAYTQINSVLVVNSESWKTFDEFITEAKRRTLSVGLPGKGTVAHLNVLLLAKGTGINVNYVPYDGGAQALASLAGKHCDFASTSVTSALPLIKAGKLRPLLIFGNKRDNAFPEIPIVRELGLKSTPIPSIRGIDGPPKMEQRVIKIIEEAFFKTSKDPGYVAWAKNRMMENIPLTHEEYREAVVNQQKEVEKYKDIFMAPK